MRTGDGSSAGTAPAAAALVGSRRTATDRRAPFRCTTPALEPSASPPARPATEPTPDRSPPASTARNRHDPQRPPRHSRIKEVLRRLLETAPRSAQSLCRQKIGTPSVRATAGSAIGAAVPYPTPERDAGVPRCRADEGGPLRFPEPGQRPCQCTLMPMSGQFPPGLRGAMEQHPAGPPFRLLQWVHGPRPVHRSRLPLSRSA